jgi:hypothetical protein
MTNYKFGPKDRKFIHVDEFVYDGIESLMILSKREKKFLTVGTFPFGTPISYCKKVPFL